MRRPRPCRSRAAKSACNRTDDQEVEDLVESQDPYASQPWIEGRLWVIPELHRGVYGRREVDVWIGGDPEGLRSLGEHLIWLANLDQEKAGTPLGERAHSHLRPKYSYGFGGELGADSCPVEICRLDASGTGDIYPHLLAAEQDLANFTPDTTPPEVWLLHARVSLDLARTSAHTSELARQHVPVLAGQAAFCSLTAGLRALGVSVPENPDYITSVTHFVPEELTLPFPVHVIRDLLVDDMPRPEGRWRRAVDEEQITLCLRGAEEMLAWAEEQTETTLG